MPRTLHGPSLAILMYHAVVRHPLAVWDWCFLDEGEFTRQMEYLKLNFDVVPLRAAAIPQPQIVRRTQVALTFDDGFRNNIDVVLPVLTRLGLPATFFLATDFVGTKLLPWFCQVNRAVSLSTLAILDWDGEKFDLSTASAKATAAARLQALLKSRPQPRLLKDLAALIECLVPNGLPEAEEDDMKRYGVLSVEQVKALARSPLIELGAHSTSHAILSLLEPAAMAREVGQSVQQIAALTGRSCDTFAYPNGRASDYTPECVDLLDRLGVTVAVTTVHGVNDHGQPLLELKRLGIGADMSFDEFKEILPQIGEAPKVNAPRKLLFVYRVCGLGGVETSILNKAKALRQMGCEVEALFFRFWGDGGEAMSQYEGFHVQTSIDGQIEVIRRFAPNVIIIIDTPECFDYVAKAAPLAAIYFETHASYLPVLDFFYSRINDSAVVKVIAPSAFNKGLLTKRGLLGERINVIANSVDLGMFCPDPNGGCELSEIALGEGPLILSVGRVEPQKNTLEFVQIGNELLSQGVDSQFVVVGDAVDTAEYAAQVHKAVCAAHQARFCFIPRLLYEDMPRLYARVARSGGCLVVTSLNESQPMIILEAMACGCPVVAANVGGISDVVIDLVTGRLYTPGDAAAAVVAIRQILQDAGMRERIVCQATEFVGRHHSPQQVAEQYLALLQTATGIVPEATDTRMLDRTAQNQFNLSESHMRKTPIQQVKDMYVHLMRRAPGEQELANWTKWLESHSFEALFYEFVTSPEYVRQKRVHSVFEPGHYHSAVVDPATVREYVEWSVDRPIAGIEVPLDAMQDFFTRMLDVFVGSALAQTKQAGQRFYLDTSPFPYGDALSLRAMMNEYRPKRIIEIGSGFSTAVMLDAADEFDIDVDITCIEPYPDRLRSLLRTEDHKRIELIQDNLQAVPLDRFRELEPGDFLFIDSTHVMKTGSDVHYELFHILPVLADGVVIHIHDIQFPFEYPEKWIYEENYSWNEIYALRAFLMYNERFSILYWFSALRRMRMKWLERAAPTLMNKNPGGSIWLRVNAQLHSTPEAAA